MKTITKYLMMMIAMVAMCVNFSSCKDDDDEPTSEYHDYYIQCKVSGGGLDAAELNYMESQLNAKLADVEWEMLKKDEAIYYFDTAMKELRASFSEGISGITVKTTTLNVTKNGCTLN